MGIERIDRGDSDGKAVGGNGGDAVGAGQSALDEREGVTRQVCGQLLRVAATGVVGHGVEQHRLLQQSEFKDVFGSASWRWLGPEQSVEDFASKLHSVLELAPYALLVLALLLGLESYFAVSYGKRRAETPA